MEKEENAKVVIQIFHQSECAKMNDDEITDEIDKKYEKLLDEARGIDTTSDELNEESTDENNSEKAADETSASNVVDMMLGKYEDCLLYTSPSTRDGLLSSMPSSA